MVKLNVRNLLGEAEGSGNLQFHLRPVLRIPAPALGLPVDRHGKGIVTHHFLDILLDTVGIAELLLLEFPAHLVAEFEGDPLIHHRLTAQYIPVVFHGDVDVRKHLLVRLPMEHRAGLLPVRRLLFQAAHVSAPFKVEVIPITVPADGGIEEFGSILGGTGAQAIQAQGILVVLAVFAILAAGVHFTENQLPVIAFFLLVIVHRTAAAKILHFNTQVLVAGDNDGVTVALPGFVDGV